MAKARKPQLTRDSLARALEIVCGVVDEIIQQMPTGLEPYDEEFERRFWRLVEKPAEGAEGCWEWRGSRSPQGYGRVKVDGQMKYAHRVAWKLSTRNPVPSHLWILHRCDNPPCVRPDHLYAGTPLENGRDRSVRGRTRNQYSKKGSV